MIFAGLRSGNGRYGGRATLAHSASHANPSAPVTRNAALHPNRAGDRDHQERRHDRSQRSAAIGNRDPARLAVRGQGIHGRAESPGEGGAFAESQQCARRGESQESGRAVPHPRMRRAGNAPDGHRRQHAFAQSDVIQQRAPQRIPDHVGDGERRDHFGVPLGAQSGIGEDRPPKAWPESGGPRRTARSTPS